MKNAITYWAAFIAGLLSFLSPCVLPLVPAYLSYMAGIQIQKATERASAGITWRTMYSALAFVIGFTAVFIAFGASATYLGKLLAAYTTKLTQAAGLFIMIMGAHLTGLIRINWLMREKRVSFKPRNGIKSFFMGAAFAFGWTPCVGPILAGILALAGTQQTLWQGVVLLTVYSAGLGIPFLLAALGTDKFMLYLRRYQKWLRWFEIAAGAFLIIFGILMMVGGLARFAGFLAMFSQYAL